MFIETMRRKEQSYKQKTETRRCSSKVGLETGRSILQTQNRGQV